MATANLTMIQQEPRKQQAEQHHQTPNKIRHATIPKDDAEKKADGGRRQVKEHQNQDELEELRPSRHQPHHRVHDGAEDDGRHESQRYHVKHHLRREIRDGRVVPVGSFADEEKPLGGKDVEAGERAEAEESQDEEEEPESVLEAFDVVRQSVE